MDQAHQIANQLANVGKRSLTQPSGRTQSTTDPVFSTDERKLTSWFFSRLQTIYGTKYQDQFPGGEVILKLTKREWTRLICKYTKSELDLGLEMAKLQMIKGNKDFQWPNIGSILGMTKSEKLSRLRFVGKPAVDDTQKRLNEISGRKYMDKIKKVLNVTK